MVGVARIFYDSFHQRVVVHRVQSQQDRTTVVFRTSNFSCILTVQISYQTILTPGIFNLRPP